MPKGKILRQSMYDRRRGSIVVKLFAAIDLYSVNWGRMVAKRSAKCTAEIKSIGRNVVVVSKSGPVETGPTVLLHCGCYCTIAVRAITMPAWWSHFLPVYSATIDLEPPMDGNWHNYGMAEKLNLPSDWNGLDNVMVQCTMQLGFTVVMWQLLIGTANFLTSEVTIWTCRSCCFSYSLRRG